MQRIDVPELLDDPDQRPADVAASLADLRRLNRWFGGTSVTLRHVARLMPSSAPQPVSLLDVACGSGDIPRAIASWARQRGLGLEVTLLDRNPRMLSAAGVREDGRQPGLPGVACGLPPAQQPSPGAPRFRAVVADAQRLPFTSGSFHLVTLSLALHHFVAPAAIQILREMNRVARTGWVVNDMVRSPAALGTVWLATRALGMNRITRHDGPASTRRAYTPSELLDLARQAGAQNLRLYRHPFFRMALVCHKPEAEGL